MMKTARSRDDREDGASIQVVRGLGARQRWAAIGGRDEEEAVKHNGQAIQWLLLR
ncbi:Xyloglucan galactosyltransferase KATAMARI1-like protein [Sesbania bispinosa]|nr:Xyloglucan galactosyltransferase KATAMARI1-like protein [Sesbania bispinosa]